MEHLYCELYNQMNAFIDRHTQIKSRGLSLHIPMVGNRYADQQKVRLMWIGRAINGWDDSDFFTLPLNDYLSKVKALENDRTRFAWLNGYNYRRSQFWRTCQLLHQKLAAPVWDADDWFEEIVWTNLYNVAPSKGGNPSGRLCKAQQQICGQLLQKQIALFKPTHIVFVTDGDWFFDFDQPKTVNMRLFPEISATPTCDGVVVATGVIGKSKVVVTKRPEYRFTDDEFTDAIFETFSKL